jgi:hypothetical protein
MRSVVMAKAQGPSRMRHVSGPSLQYLYETTFGLLPVPLKVLDALLYCT